MRLVPLLWLNRNPKSNAKGMERRGDGTRNTTRSSSPFPFLRWLAALPLVASLSPPPSLSRRFLLVGLFLLSGRFLFLLRKVTPSLLSWSPFPPSPANWNFSGKPTVPCYSCHNAKSFLFLLLADKTGVYVADDVLKKVTQYSDWKVKIVAALKAVV